MRHFRYSSASRPGGLWLKGNTHIHSTASDGGLNFTELATLYAGAGYDFLFRTDHWVTSDVASDAVAADLATYPLLWLDGVELDGRDDTGAAYHVVCLGRVTGLEYEKGLQPAMAAAREQGALLILAHPHWCANTLADALRHPFDGVEVYNHVCRWLNGKGDGSVYWTTRLQRHPSTLGLAVDDAHIRAEHPGWNGGWVMVAAAERTPEAILAALRGGQFYSSCGPVIHNLNFDGRAVSIETSPVQFARLVGPNSHGARTGSFDDRRLTSATFEVPDDWPYAYLEVEDDQGRRAWTNHLFTS